MAQSLKELLAFSETAEYLTLPNKNQGAILSKITRLQTQEAHNLREQEKEKARILRQKAEDDVFNALRTKSIQEISSVMKGFIPIYSFHNPVPFTVNFLRGNNGNVTFNCDSEPHFSYKDLRELSKRLGTDTITFSSKKHTTRYDLDYDNNWTFTICFPWNKGV
jgi:hypothetical protein